MENGETGAPGTRPDILAGVLSFSVQSEPTLHAPAIGPAEAGDAEGRNLLDASTPAAPAVHPSLYQHGSPLMPRIRVGSRGAGPIVRLVDFHDDFDY